MNPKAMQLNRLTIERNMYGFDYNNTPKDGIAGKISFSTGQGHEMTLTLNPQQIQEILDIVADAMINTTKELAKNLTREVIESTTLKLESDI